MMSNINNLDLPHNISLLKKTKFQRFFSQNSDGQEHLNWSTLNAPILNLQLKKDLIQEKMEQGLNNRLKALKLPSLSYPEEIENEFLTHWTTLPSRIVRNETVKILNPKKPTNFLETLKRWTSLKQQIFRTTDHHFEPLRKQKEKQYHLKKALQKLSQKKKDRKQFQPKEQFKTAISNFFTLRLQKPEARIAHSTNKRKQIQYSTQSNRKKRKIKNVKNEQSTKKEH